MWGTGCVFGPGRHSSWLVLASAWLELRQGQGAITTSSGPVSVRMKTRNSQSQTPLQIVAS